jgi:uncharacterized protein (TIGR02594 family)
MTTAPDPAWLLAARAKLGTREIPGRTHNNALISFLNTAARWNGVRWVDDEMAWCGGFVAACLVQAGVEPVKLAARAKSWATWGWLLRADRLAPGAIMVFGRGGGGHVGFYVGRDATHYHILGGNQGDAVSVTRIARNRLVEGGSRWPKGLPVTGRPITMAANSAPEFGNDA